MRQTKMQEDILRKIDNEIKRCGTIADDGNWASGHQQGIKDGLRIARNIVLMEK